jgi:hypothetical protein
MYHFFKLFYSLLILCFLVLCATDGWAQERRNERQRQKTRKQQNYRTSTFTGKRIAFANIRQYVTLGVSVSALNYFGDITPKDGILSTDISFTRPGLGLSSGLRLGPQFSLQAMLMWGRLRADDFESANPDDGEAIYRYTRNLQFRNSITDFSFVGVFDLLPNRGTVFTRAIFTPYLFAGFSVFHHNPKALVPNEAFLGPDETPIVPENAGKWVALMPLQTEGQSYGNFQFSIPLGLGVRQRINQFFDIEFEFTYRLMFFDYLDDVSGNYVDKGTLSSELAKVMSDRSREPVAVVSGEERLEAVINSDKISPMIASYTGADGQVYGHIPGYGQPGEIRGHSNDNDIFIATTIRLVYMLGKSPFEKKLKRLR